MEKLENIESRIKGVHGKSRKSFTTYYYDLRKYNLDTIKLELRDLLVNKFQSLIGDSRVEE
jgi:hypothetical protein